MPPRLVPDRLLAKSIAGEWQDSYSLLGHTADVVTTVSTLVDVLGHRLIEQFNLGCDLSYLKATMRLAAYIHDWGKANNHFQGVVRKDMPEASPKRNPLNNPQLVRHEVLSLLMAWEFQDWLREADGHFETALIVAGGHHLKLGGKAGKQIDYIDDTIVRPCGDTSLSLYLGHPDFRSVFKFGINQIGCPAKIRLPRKPTSEFSVKQIKDALNNLLFDEFLRFDLDSIFVAVCKALIVCSDSIASAAPSVDICIEQWIEEEVSRTLNEEKTQNIIDARLQGHKLRDFQTKLADSRNRVTLARAGCGTGKTLGAYAWAKFHTKGRKLFFCYPTTGTSTEGFLDYVHGQADAALLHSRAGVDLAQWEEERKKRTLKELYTTGEEEAGDSSDNEVAKKLESFKAWGREVSVCTVDTVLGLLQCNRRPIYCFPAIANAAFVFDEVHCYDDKLFGALLRFLETVKAPILLMSASFLPWQRKAIQQAVGEEIAEIEGPKDIELKPRYRFQYRADPDWNRVEQELDTGGKVLWVCNQVNTAIDVYRQAKQRNLNAVLYHSRFRYEDRVAHHRAVVDAFKPEQHQPILAIATQVAEMSLDLSATLLVTQIADPAGLIQRLGRLNRRYCGHALDAVFYPDQKEGYPYSREALKAGLALVQSFTNEVNQAELAGWLENAESRASPTCKTVLLDGGWRTYPAPLRDEGHNVTAILEEDLETVKLLPNKELPHYTIPLPNHKQKTWATEKYKFYPVADSKFWRYSKEEGAYEIY
ncbi:MAG: CRISPR-associated helicase Cas3' [Cyanobacteria bacterium P01_F01_bin.150]